MTTDELKQLRAYARQDGLILALVWTLSFLTIVYLPTTSWGVLLMLSTPFVMFWRLRKFREDALDGTISFGRALLYCIQLFGGACILFALVQFGYFQLLDHGRFFQLIADAMEQVRPIYEQQGISTDDMQQAVEQMKGTTPIQLTGSFLVQNLFLGIIVSPVVALFGKRK